MVRKMFVVMGVAAAVWLPVAVGARTGETLGAGVKQKNAIAVSALYAKPADFVGKTIRIDGVVTAVCEEMGCWMALAASDNKDLVIRFKVGHDAGIVFPVSAKGKPASAEGVFEKISADDKEAQEAAKEQSGDAKTESKASAFGKLYQVKATGAVLR